MFFKRVPMTIKHKMRVAANRVLAIVGLELVPIGGEIGGEINNGAFWDRYVKSWSDTPEHRGLNFVGDEWKNQNIFLGLLKKYSSSNRTALEIGCGGGRITAVAAPQFKHIYASDVSNEMLKSAKQKLTNSNISYHVLDGFTLSEFEPNSIDLVYSHDVFVHFSALQVYPYFKEIKRVLRPGGLGLISFYNTKRHFDYMKDMSIELNQKKLYPPHMRVHFITEEVVRLMLDDLEMQVVDVDTENFLIVGFKK